MRILIIFFTFLFGTFGVEPPPWVATRISSMIYPRLALQAQISGTVRLRVSIDSSGSVTEVTALSGSLVLSAAARENVKNWKFVTTSRALNETQSADKSIELLYIFKLEGIARSCPNTDFTYEYPNMVLVTAAAPHWLP